MRRRVAPTVAALIAAGAVVAVIAGISVVWPGLDAQQTPPRDTTAWVLQADGLRYARVNTAIDELDTVRTVSNPSRIVATPTGSYMFTDSDAKVVRIDDAVPVDLDAEGLRSAQASPPGTQEVDTAGDYVAYRTDAGAVFAGRLSTGSLVQVDPTGDASTGSSDASAPTATSDAIAVDARGELFSYSAEAGTVIRVDIASNSVQRTDRVEVDAASPVLTAAGDEWVLVEPATGRYWSRAQSATAGTNGTVSVSRTDPDGDAVYLADETGLVRVPTANTPAERVFGDRTTARGAPARPVVRAGVVHAAWLPEGQGPGTLWDSASGDVTLDYAGATLPTQRRPVFVDAGDGLVLNDARSGWVWRVPDGALVPSSQDWDLDAPVQTAPQTTEQEPPAVIDPRPPVAVADSFGVRAGALVTLPVLLNDHDPNEDVLTIDPASVEGLDPAFGTLTLTDDRQRLAVRVAADASGSASFRYAVSDGTTPDGLLSEPATVTLRVAGEDENSAPQWCGVEGCQQEWPQPEVAPGGTVSVPVLGDWVDPEGDPVILLSATEDTALGQVAATPEGTVVYQHSDSGAGGEELAAITLTVGDARGATTTKTLSVRVRGDAQPRVQSFAVVDTAGSRVSVDVAPHVTGTAGSVTLSSARVLDDAAATATVVGGTTQFDFAATAAGTYRVAVTVSADGREATGTARITLLAADAPAQLATAPVVAFVRPQADATVDVLAAVSNPTGRVLLLSDVVVHAASGSSLTGDAVGQSQLRVSGSTAGGDPGLLGTVSYTVSDGTADAGASVIGEATVYLLPAASEAAPITVDDAVVVRAGSQIDIPVLANDVAAAGGIPRLDPESTESSTPDALAFASGDVLRYLAPETAGQYTVSYRAFTTGSPTLGDVATVRVQVTAPDANRDPLPRRLSGRVGSGLSTTIPFDGFGMDPDGDVVRLESIVGQPAHGSAAISADGTSIVYTSIAGVSGQDAFTYRVVDAFGATGEGTVRVGVLSGEANPSPVTYTDYVHVQAGGGNVIRVHPLANDIDPTQGSLTLAAVRPDAPELALDGTPTDEYARLKSRIQSVTDDTVTIAAGTDPGTMAFFYDVESSSGNTARGLIVVKVVAQRVPDFPVVADTVLTAADRDDLADGVDVLRGKVLWSGGDASDLVVGLWGSPEGVSVSGSRVRAEPSDAARLIPFSVTGESASGPVTTYAFVRVPAASEGALSLRAGVSPIVAAENGQAEADIAAMVAVPRGRTLEIGAADVRASGARPAAVCAPTTGTGVRYTAGGGAPWTDACLVPVRLVGGSAWTVLAIPVAITPLDPQPTLAPASLEIAPGDTHVYDLTAMTTWRGPAEAIQYRVTGSPASFALSLDGSQLTVRAADSAAPGAVEGVMVEVTSHAGVTPARITLRVGAAPSTLPQGGQTTRTCSQASGASCTVDVVGAPGEVNPLPGTPLQVVAVTPTSSCTGVSFAVAGPSSITASWTADAPGATCSARFTVRDAQGRQSAAARDGGVTIDLQGFPRAPASVSQSAYADGSLTLRVDPGPAQTSYPAVTGFEVRYGGERVTTCTPQGVCPALAAPNGEQRRYEVVSVNAVGPSQTAVATTAWAYDPPATPTSASAVPAVAGAEGGVAALTFAGVDAAATSALQISSPVGESITVPVAANQTTVTVPAFRVGANMTTSVTVSPVSRFDAPPGLGGPAIGSVVVQAHGVGAPTNPVLTLTPVNVGGGRVDITATATAGPGGDGAATRYGIVAVGETCRATAGGDRAVFRGLLDGRVYTFTLCVEAWFGGTLFGRATVDADVRAVQSTAAPRGYTFVVAPTAHVDGARANWTIDENPTSPEALPNENVAVFSGLPSSVFDTDPGIRVRYEHVSGWWQSEWGAVTPAPGSAPTQVQATWSLGACTGGTRLTADGRSTGDRARFTFDTADIAYYDAAGARLDPGDDPWQVPATASRVEGIRVIVDWARTGWNLDAATAPLSARCTPVPPTDGATTP
ncbi:Ig-like domain-containing protein [uncultured Microbacterium sp.]|uniref:Ig-like domain-containing protein n=1 Tax=uncultured Microbacterium sp. TaxID=191216 RepID=UPI0025976E82|nr:Ig-like domain-containing protein [uncultured Microbacterium sp.]